MIRKWVSGLALAVCLSEAHGFVGPADVDDEHPYVVEIFADKGAKNALCTGAAITRRMVITAAHCVYGNGKGAEDIVIRFKKPSGEYGAARAQKTFLHPVFAELEPAVRAIEKKAKDEKRGFTPEEGRERLYLAAHDFAAIVPDVDVAVREYAPRTILDESFPFLRLVRERAEPVFSIRLVGSINWKMRNEFLPLFPDGRVYSAGYGVFACTNYEDAASCEKPDGTRRYGSAPHGTNTWWFGRIKNEPLFVFLTQKDDAHPQPFRKGDSGAPVMLRASDGTNIIIGVVSLSSHQAAIHASLIQNADVWLRSLQSAEYAEALAPKMVGVIAFSTNRVGMPRYGIHFAWTEQEAAEGALRKCRTRATRCEVRYVFGRENSRCGYVSTGTRGTRARVAYGISPEKTLATCRRGGFSCRPPVGGCV